jgi:hypothetical protein
MPKLTPEQFRLLHWLSLPETCFEVSREDGFMDDKYNGLHAYNDGKGNRYKFDIRTLYILEGFELIQGEIVNHFGIAWERYTLTNKGEVTLVLSPSSGGVNEFQ